MIFFDCQNIYFDCQKKSLKGRAGMNESRIKATNKWNKKTYYNMSVRIRKDNEIDIIRWLESQESKNAYIIGLIKKDMEKRGS